MFILESAFDTSISHCLTLIKQKQALYDGLNELSDILQQPRNVTKEELMKIITDTFDKALLITE
jgi:hypothetical protein